MAMFTWYRDADKKTRRIFWTCSAGWAMDMADGVVSIPTSSRSSSPRSG